MARPCVFCKGGYSLPTVLDFGAFVEPGVHTSVIVFERRSIRNCNQCPIQTLSNLVSISVTNI